MTWCTMTIMAAASVSLLASGSLTTRSNKAIDAIAVIHKFNETLHRPCPVLTKRHTKNIHKKAEVKNTRNHAWTEADSSPAPNAHQYHRYTNEVAVSKADTIQYSRKRPVNGPHRSFDFRLA